MSLRDQLNQRPALITAVTVGILVLAMVLIGYQIWPRGGSNGSDRTIIPAPAPATAPS